MKLSQVFRKAARIIARDNERLCVCASLGMASDTALTADLADVFFGALYRPEVGAAAYYMGYENGVFSPEDYLDDSEAKARRILALLFASEIARSEGL